MPHVVGALWLGIPIGHEHAEHVRRGDGVYRARPNVGKAWSFNDSHQLVATRSPVQVGARRSTIIVSTPAPISVPLAVANFAKRGGGLGKHGVGVIYHRLRDSASRLSALSGVTASMRVSAFVLSRPGWRSAFLFRGRVQSSVTPRTSLKGTPPARGLCRVAHECAGRSIAPLPTCSCSRANARRA